jgi:transposase
VRRWLLHLVKERGFRITEAAEVLSINYSSAKTILQKYRRTGKIDNDDVRAKIGIRLRTGV